MPLTSPATTRRRWLQGSGAVLLGGVALMPAHASTPADEDLAFAAPSFAAAWAALGGMPTPCSEIRLELPTVAENGAVVPVSVASELAGTHEILIVVDGNPQPVAARFSVPPGTEPYVATRIRLAGPGTVVAAVRTDSGLYAVARAVQVTVGGCG